MPKSNSIPKSTKAILSLLSSGGSFAGEDERGYRKSSAKWSPEDIEIAYNIFSKEFGFKPEMVNRSNVVLGALPSELLSVLTTGDVTKELRGVRRPLLNIYFGNNKSSKKELLDAILKYGSKHNIYNEDGRAFVGRAVDSGLLNETNLRNIYFEKYAEDK